VAEGTSGFSGRRVDERRTVVGGRDFGVEFGSGRVKLEEVASP
jgi:hypothetical protein